AVWRGDCSGCWPAASGGRLVAALELDQRLGLERRSGQGLRVAPEIDHRNLVDAGDRAAGSALFLSPVSQADVIDRVLLERDTRISALLGAVVDQAVLADVDIASAGAAFPLVRLSVGDIALEVIDAAVGALAEGFDPLVDALLGVGQLAQLSA